MYTISEASQATGVAEITIRRFVSKYCTDPDYSHYFNKDSKQRWLINRAFIEQHYPLKVSNDDQVMKRSTNDTGMINQRSEMIKWMQDHSQKLSDTIYELAEQNKVLIRALDEAQKREVDLRSKGDKLLKYYLTHSNRKKKS